MRLLLDNMIISSEIRSKVMDYINRPRSPKAMIDCDVFKRTEFSPFKFVSNMFEQRVDEALEYIYVNKVSGTGDFIQIAKDIPKFLSIDHSESDDSMTFYMILERNWDFIIISLDEVSDNDDEFTTYWMGLYFTGEADNCDKLLNEMGIDATKALQDTLLKPKLPPEGYDHTKSVVTNLYKVCCPEDSVPEAISYLMGELLMPNIEPIVCDSEQISRITYEDVWFPVWESDYHCFIYRNRLNEDQTYLFIVNKNNGEVKLAMIAEDNADGEYVLTPSYTALHAAHLSAVDELR